MNVQDYLNRYRNKELNLTSTALKLNDDIFGLQGIIITATNGFGIEVNIKIPIDADLDNMFVRETIAINRSQDE